MSWKHLVLLDYASQDSFVVFFLYSFKHTACLQFTAIRLYYSSTSMQKKKIIVWQMSRLAYGSCILIIPGYLYLNETGCILSGARGSGKNTASQYLFAPSKVIAAAACFD